DSTMLLIPHRVDISIPFAVLKPTWGRIVLDDEVVPIRYPKRTVRANLGMHWAKPFVRAGQNVECVLLAISRAFFDQARIVEDAACRFGYESHLVPIFFRKVSCRIEVMSCRCGIASMPIDLSQERSDVWHVIMRVDSSSSIWSAFVDSSFRVFAV